MVSALASRSQLRQFDHARLFNVILFAARLWKSILAGYCDRSKSRKIPGDTPWREMPRAENASSTASIDGFPGARNPRVTRE
jgi:hypothetical protein